jgi:hypothetical protein
MPRTGKLAAVALQMAVLVLALPTPAPAAGDEARVLVVGDSLEVLTSPHLQRHLPGIDLTVNAEGGYNSFQIFDLFGESYEPSHSVIVFDAGTNDNPAHPEILAGNLSAVAAAVGDRCMVVPTVHGFTVDGIDNTGKNRVVERFAASRPGTETPDWAGTVAEHPELMQADNLHPTAEGADYRAQLIADGVLGCLAFGSAPERPRARPELAAPRRMAARQAALVEAIGAGLVRRLLGGWTPFPLR